LSRLLLLKATMNRYPLWKYIIVAVALVLGFVYTLPNFFGESPAVQVSSAKATIKVDDKAKARAEEALIAAAVVHDGIQLDTVGIKARFKDTDTQLKAKDILEKTFNPNPAEPQYVVALNLLAASPTWLTSLHALPMYLGLDLRGGVHFLLQVDMKGALTKRLDSTSADLRTAMRDKNLRHAGVGREGERIVVRFRDVETRDKARNIIADTQPDLILADQGEGSDLKLVATLKPAGAAENRRIRPQAEHHDPAQPDQRTGRCRAGDPAAGRDRIVVQLPGVQDTAKAKDILGRTAPLKSAWSMTRRERWKLRWRAIRPLRHRGLYGTRRPALLVKKQVVLTGDRLTDAQPGFDNQTNEAAVHLTLDSPAPAFSRMSPARTWASAWPSC
jgi:preprotein translocase subunit SecD